MRRSAIIFTATCAVISAAHADDIPKRFTGTWCQVTDGESLYARKKKCDSHSLEIEATYITDFSEDTYGCRLIELWGLQQNRFWGKFLCVDMDGAGYKTTYQKIGVTIGVTGVLEFSATNWDN